MATHVRDALVRALTARVRHFLTTYDHDAVLAPEALEQARKLMGCVPDPTRDPEAVRAIAGLHRCRALLLTGDRARRDAAVADALEPLAGPAPREDDGPEAAGLTSEALAEMNAAQLRASEAVARAERSPDRHLLDDALRAARAAVDHTPASLLPFRAAPLAHLGLVLRLRFERTGAPEDLDEAVRVLRDAEAGAGRGHPNRRAVVTGLGVALRERYERDSALKDLQDAVRFAREAVAPPGDGEDGPGEDDDHNRGGSRHNLGLALRLRHERTDSPQDLDESIRWHREAVSVTPPGHPGYAMFWLGLGNALGEQFRRTEATADLQAQLAAYEEAAGVGPADDRARPAISSSLASALTERHITGGADKDADRAERLLRDAAATLPDGHPVQASVRYQLGRVLLARYARSARWPDLEEALTCYAAAAQQPTAPPRVRLLAATHWGTGAMSVGDPGQAAQAYGSAVELLPMLAARHLTPGDAEHALAGLPHLASDAAACALHAGDAERAVSLLELGRGVLLGQGLQGRDDLAALRRQAPELAERLAELRTALDAPDGGTAATADVSENADVTGNAAAADIRHALAREWNGLLTEIRSGLPGFEHFLLPPPVERLREQAMDGPIVVVNVSRFRCDALVLTRGGLRVVPLPRLTLEAAEEETAGFLAALDRLSDPGTDLVALPEQEDRLAACLRWLWDAVAGPVLDALGIAGPAVRGAARQRMWWVPTGPLVVLPLHAAGHQREAVGRSVLDRVVSSYAPTVQALAHARRPGPDHKRRAAVRRRRGADSANCLVVAVPRAPAARPLPRAAEEAAAVTELLPETRLLGGALACRDAVVDGLRQHPWLHFCGHGVADPTSPSASRLLVHDHLEHPLTVADIARLDLRDAELAYLSACGTAHAGLRLADEALHLTSALQLAGYRHVVGTLWAIEDTVAKRIAQRFYRELGAPRPVADRAARAVHATVRATRDRYPDTPSLWAAHIHVGS